MYAERKVRFADWDLINKVWDVWEARRRELQSSKYCLSNQMRCWDCSDSRRYIYLIIVIITAALLPMELCCI